jgi:hypothetical protein
MLNASKYADKLDLSRAADRNIKWYSNSQISMAVSQKSERCVSWGFLPEK